MPEQLVGYPLWRVGRAGRYLLEGAVAGIVLLGLVGFVAVLAILMSVAVVGQWCWDACTDEEAQPVTAVLLCILAYVVVLATRARP